MTVLILRNVDDTHVGSLIAAHRYDFCGHLLLQGLEDHERRVYRVRCGEEKEYGDVRVHSLCRGLFCAQGQHSLRLHSLCCGKIHRYHDVGEGRVQELYRGEGAAGDGEVLL